MEFSHFIATCRLNGDVIFVIFSSTVDGKEVTFTSQVSLFCFLSPVLSFYGCSFVCGVVVNGDEGVQRKVVVGKAVSLHVFPARS